MGKKPPPGFGNTPFRDLPRQTPPKPGPTAPPPAARPPKPPPARPVDEERVFQEAMRGVTPLRGDGRTRRTLEPAREVGPKPAPPSSASRAAARATDDALAEAELADLIDAGGGGALAMEEVGESVTALAPGVDRRVLKRLRAGQFPVDAELDLHGRSREQAAADLVRFFARAREEARRCLLVIHGRGLGSGPEGAVLRGLVRETLAQGGLGRQVLAFATAPPALGGEGALLVLLRRRPPGGR
jgi:DNA-nicking Smr family endonuclease